MLRPSDYCRKNIKNGRPQRGSMWLLGMSIMEDDPKYREFLETKIEI